MIDGRPTLSVADAKMARDERFVHSVRNSDFLCNLYVMDSYSVTNLRQHIAEVIDEVCADGGPIYLTRHGKRVAAIIDADEMDRLLELAEDMEDIREAAEARLEMEITGQEAIPWEEVKAELGLQ